MLKACPSCNGTGILFSDCPYCRCTDDFEYTQLSPGACIACHDLGYLEDICHICNGTGQITVDSSTLAKAGNY